ncbi:MAG: PrsW family intramembrane metalloprotease [Methanobacteriota archaeon]|nr:MAG: PrsW family intramembrane metalloprotease [Euryarchaeota archaeon]
MVDATTTLLILAVSAFIPPLVFLSIVRGTERYGREPWGRVLRTFFWGAVFAVIIASILELLLYAVYNRYVPVRLFLGQDLGGIVLVLVIAPIVEEFAKGIGVYLARPAMDEPEDGLVYGAAAGFGFAASENLLYGLLALTLPGGSIGESIIVIGIRSLSSALLHATASGMFGYGIALNRLWPHLHSPLPYYLLAVMMHSTFNFLASLGEIGTPVLGDNAALFGLAGAILLAVAAFIGLRWLIVKHDEQRVTW